MMYPVIKPKIKEEMPLQSHLFGHRLRPAQTKYEYLLEFLLVALSPKRRLESTFGDVSYDEMFPIEDKIKSTNLQYSPTVSMGLKRFIFFSNGKLDGKAPIDKDAHQTLLRELESKMQGRGNYKDHLFLLENLFNGYTATEQNRSWFVQSTLPICPEVIFPFCMMYQKAGTESHSNYWVIDVNSPDFDNKEMKKFAQNHFLKNEDALKNHLYQGFEIHQDDLKQKDEKVAVSDSYKYTIEVFRKLGKNIGLIIPMTGAGMRFTLSEDLIKFLVLALIPPKNMMTLDDFLEQLHLHFNMIIGPEEYKKETGTNVFLKDNFLPQATTHKQAPFIIIQTIKKGNIKHFKLCLWTKIKLNFWKVFTNNVSGSYV